MYSFLRNTTFVTLSLLLVVETAFAGGRPVQPTPPAPEARFVSGIQSTDLSAILADPIREYVYVADAPGNTVHLVSTLSEQAVSLAVPGSPQALALTKNSLHLAVALGEAGVATIDINRRLVRHLPITDNVISVAYSRNGMLYYATRTRPTGSPWGEIVKFNSQIGIELHRFGRGSSNSPVYDALLKTDSSGRFLYVGEQGLSPASLYKFDISGATSVFLAEDAHGTLGSNLRDFVIAPRGGKIYLASGSPYGIQVVDAGSLARVDLLDETGAYPNGVAIDRFGYQLYGSTQGNNYNAYQFNTSTTELHNTLSPLTTGHSLEGIQNRGVAVSRDGKKLFLLTGNSYFNDASWQLQVINTGVDAGDQEIDRLFDVIGEFAAQQFQAVGEALGDS